MKRFLVIASGLGIPACIILAYVKWRTGTIVASRSFDGFRIQVRELPEVNGILSNPPGIAESAYVVEVGNSRHMATYRFFQASAKVKPIEIVRIDGADGLPTTYEVRFSDVQPVGIKRVRGGAEWYQPTLWHHAFEQE